MCTIRNRQIHSNSVRPRSAQDFCIESEHTHGMRYIHHICGQWALDIQLYLRNVSIHRPVGRKVMRVGCVAFDAIASAYQNAIPATRQPASPLSDREKTRHVRRMYNVNAHSWQTLIHNNISL